MSHNGGWWRDLLVGHETAAQFVNRMWLKQWDVIIGNKTDTTVNISNDTIMWLPIKQEQYLDEEIHREIIGDDEQDNELEGCSIIIIQPMDRQVNSRQGNSSVEPPHSGHIADGHVKEGIIFNSWIL